MRRRRYPRQEFIPRAKPLEAQGGIKAQSRQGDFGTSWWAKRWQTVLDNFRIGGRLERGRIYARKGQVLAIDIHAGEVTARVQGSRQKPYDVTIGVSRLDREEWDQVFGVLSRQALFVAKLLAGEMPQDIERVFTQAGVSLFPKKRGDLRTTCSCPDEANPCKHIAAVYYLLGEEFDRDPFLLFRLRGRSRDEFIALLGDSTARSSAVPKTPPVPPQPLSTTPTAFWQGRPIPDDLFGAAAVPDTPTPLPATLGALPFWRGDDDALALARVTELIAKAAPRGAQVVQGERSERTE
jgi:uncharacterized Zn finger protein